MLLYERIVSVVLLLGLALPCTSTLWSRGASEQESNTAQVDWISQRKTLEISESILQLSKDAMDLSALSFQNDVDVAEEEFEYYRFFQDGPEQAIVAAVHGHCFAAFRGSVASWGDWYQNLQPGMTPVCRGSDDNEEDKLCCSNVRSGFHAAYNSSIRDALETSLQECLANYTTCNNSDDKEANESNSSCLVFTGFSSGGAIAHVASLYHAALNPLLITFGQPPTVEPDGCDLFPTNRIYRWINTIDNFLGQERYAYDIVSSASFYTSAGQVGHMLVLPPKNSVGVAYFGLNPSEAIWQVKPTSVMAHPHQNFIWDPVYRPGYRERLSYLIMNVREYPFVANGFEQGSLCARDNECQSGQCTAHLFAPRKCT